MSRPSRFWSSTRRAAAAIAVGGLTMVGERLGAQLTDLGNQLLEECAASVETCEANDRFGSAVAAGDFNGDGFVDLAVSVPGETISGQANAGAVHVFYGSPGGLKLTGDQVFTQATAGIAGTPEAGDRWGSVLAAGFFNGDAFADLAVGAPLEDLVVDGVNRVDAGSIEVLFGSAAGLTASGSLYFDQNNLPCLHTESVEAGDRFGGALAAIAPSGGATHDSLAVGAPAEDGIFADEGVVIVIGQRSGGTLNGCKEIRQSDYFAACGEIGELNDRFGAALADLGGSLVIGAPGETVDGLNEAGILVSDAVCRTDPIPGSFDRFAATLASGNFDADDLVDLAVGVPGELDSKGSVWVLEQLPTAPFLSAPRTVWSQTALSDPEPGDEFGSAVAIGDFDGNGWDDLAIGSPGEELFLLSPSDLRDQAGQINVVYGAADGSGLSRTGSQTFHQDFPATMQGAPGTLDRFGEAIAAGDFDGNGVDDLAVGVPGDNPAGVADGGRVQVIYGLDRQTGAFGTVFFGSNGAVSFPEEQGARVLFVFRDGGAVIAASVARLLDGGTATAGADFTYTNGVESWSAGELGFETFGVTIHEDSIPEPNETIVIRLGNPSLGLALGSPSTLTITIVDDDGGNCFGLGGTHLGEGLDPVPSPTSSPGCPPGNFTPGTVVQVTAAPAPGWIVVRWSGTDDDTSRALVNSVTMPPNASKAFSVFYFPVDLVIARTSLGPEEPVIEACNSITTVGPVDVVAGADVTLRAGSVIAFGDGLFVAGELAVELATPAVCP